MLRLWGKLMNGHKIAKDGTLEIDASAMDWSLFYGYVSDLCHSLDCPTPVIIKSHIFNFAKFNFVKFTKSDFVEKFDYDSLVIENIKD